MAGSFGSGRHHHPRAVPPDRVLENHPRIFVRDITGGGPASVGALSFEVGAVVINTVKLRCGLHFEAPCCGRAVRSLFPDCGFKCRACANLLYFCQIRPR